MDHLENVIILCLTLYIGNVSCDSSNCLFSLKPQSGFSEPLMDAVTGVSWGVRPLDGRDDMRRLLL